MHNHGGSMSMWRLCFATAAFAMLTCAVGEIFLVGGDSGWKPNVNYTRWAADISFNVGDFLFFVFDASHYNVLEVKKSNYERCNDSDFVKNITLGGRSLYNLTEERSYYFLSSGSANCFNGMKLAIDVRRPLPPPPVLDVESAINN